MITLDDARTMLTTRFGGVLQQGAHGGQSACCVMELRSVLRGEPWNDDSDVTAHAARTLNDGAWSSGTARTEGCLPLVLLADATAAVGWIPAYVEGTIRVMVPLALRCAAKLQAAPHQGALLAAAACCERDASAVAEAAATARAARTAVGSAALCIPPAPIVHADNAAVYAADASLIAATEAATVANVRCEATAVYAAAKAAKAANAAASTVYAAAKAANAAARADAVLRVGVALLIAAHRGPRPWEDPEVVAALAATQA